MTPLLNLLNIDQHARELQHTQLSTRLLTVTVLTM